MSKPRVTVKDMVGLVEALGSDVQIAKDQILPCTLCPHEGQCRHLCRGDYGFDCPVLPATLKRLRGRK